MPTGIVLAKQFDSLAQQRAAGDMGMWVFIASELLFFGVLFFGYTVTRIHFPEAFAAASRHTDIVLGIANTAILLTSSYTMALAVHAAGNRAGGRARTLLGLTLLFGAFFLGIKAIEYFADYRHHLVPALNFSFEPNTYAGAALFFYLYFVMTGFHAIHLAIGMGLVACAAWRIGRAHPRGKTRLQLGLVALYWHLVDLVWIFLFPLLYLVART